MSTPRRNHTATLLDDGRVLVTGGGFGVASAELYDPGTNTWSAAPSMSVIRGVHTATLLSDGRVLVTGGDTGIDDHMESAQLYDPATNTWSAAPSLNRYRISHTATLLSDGAVLVTGGDVQRRTANARCITLTRTRGLRRRA